jgi:hypothetical protein
MLRDLSELMLSLILAVMLVYVDPSCSLRGVSGDCPMPF